jgi:hypothetical protein
MIRLLAHPLHPLPSVSSTGDTQEDREREKGVGEEPKYTTARKPDPL